MNKRKIVSLCLACFMMIGVSGCSQKSEAYLLSNEKAISIMNESGLAKNVSVANFDVFYPYAFINLQSAYNINVTLYKDGEETMVGRIDESEVENFFLAFTIDEKAESFWMNYYIDSKESDGYLTSTPHNLTSGNETYTDFFLEEYEVKDIEEKQYLGIVDFTGRIYREESFQKDAYEATQANGCVITLEMRKSEK